MTGPSCVNDLAKYVNFFVKKGLFFGIAVANIPGLTVTHLFLMYGILRAATLLPTILTLKGVTMTPQGIVIGIISALLIGFPVFAYGNIYGIAIYKTIGSLTTVLLSGAVAWIISRKARRWNE